MSHSQRVVVVTGASTGIGRATALLLDGLGFSVFAGFVIDDPRLTASMDSTIFANGFESGDTSAWSSTVQ